MQANLVKTQLKPGSTRELLTIAIPLAISSGSISLMHVIDRIYLTWYSKEALAAAMPAGLLNWTLMSIAIGTAGYVNAFVAQYEGAKQPERVAAALWQGIYFCLLASVVMMGVVPLAPLIFNAFGHDAAVRALEIEYFSILGLGAAPVVLSAALACFYSGRGRTRVIMLANFTTAGVNILLDYLLIFGKFGLPELGMRGAAIATVLGHSAGVLAYVVAMLYGSEGRTYRLWPAHPIDMQLFRRLLKYGLPSGLHMFMDIACFTLFIQLVGMMGTEQLAATNLAFNLNTLAFVPMLGFGTAVMTLTGQRVGEGRPELAVRTTWVAFLWASVYMGLFAALYVFAPDLVLAPYAQHADPEEFAVVARYVTMLLKFVAIYAVFDAMAIIFSSAIRGAGDTRFALVFSTFSGIALLVIPTWVIHHYWGPQLLAAWSAVAAFIIVLGVGFMIRFQRGAWKTMRVIESTLTEEEPMPAVPQRTLHHDLVEPPNEVRTLEA